MLAGFWIVLGGIAAAAGFSYVNSTVREDGSPRK
jgi:hypothetical protein